MTIDMTPIMEAVITLVCAIITCVLIPWIKSKTTKEQQERLYALVKIAVEAAEQAIKGSGKGFEKKRYVLDWMEAHGYHVDIEKVDLMIESAVYEMNNYVNTW